MRRCHLAKSHLRVGPKVPDNPPLFKLFPRSPRIQQHRSHSTHETWKPGPRRTCSAAYQQATRSPDDLYTTTILFVPGHEVEAQTLCFQCTTRLRQSSKSSIDIYRKDQTDFEPEVASPQLRASKANKRGRPKIRIVAPNHRQDQPTTIDSFSELPSNNHIRSASADVVLVRGISPLSGTNEPLA